MNEYLDVVKGNRSDKVPVQVTYTNPFEVPPVHSSTEDAAATTKTSSTEAVTPEVAVPVKEEPVPAAVTEPVAPKVEVATSQPVEEFKEAVPTPAVDEEVKSVQPAPVFINGEQKYFVIGGCFRSRENAENFVVDMKSKNIDANIIGQNKAGLYMVSLFSSSNYNQTTDSLVELKSKAIESAWVYKK